MSPELRDLALIPLGLVAGALTTLAGLGGGLMLVAVLSVLFDPKLALTLTAPALALGNLHRATLYRAHLDREVAIRVAGAGFVAALIFGVLALRCPDWLLRLLLLTATLFALARATHLVELTFRRIWLVPMGFLIGAVTATSGGGPALLAPTLMSAGLSGERYVSTASVCALSVHVARVLAYGASGFLDVSQLTRSAILAIAVLGGNAIGARIRPSLAHEDGTRLELGALVLVVCATLAGFGRG